METTLPRRPFAIQPPKNELDHLATDSSNAASLLPATTRTKADHIRVPDAGNVDFLEKELLVQKLNDVHHLLWLCGRPMPPRPFHYQKVLQRSLTVVENVALHLVWSKDRIFIKPLPRWLLDGNFWAQYIIPEKVDMDERQRELAACAVGLLFSYTALIAYESDWRIAHEKGLLPESITWEKWKVIAAEILETHDYRAINPRYLYGELRLGRLNQIYTFRLGHVFRQYSKVSSHISYNDVLRDNFAALAAMLAYVVVVLTAMQVGLATTRLGSSQAFQAASWGFTVFTILAPLIACAAIVMTVAVMFVSNWVATRIYHTNRGHELGMHLSSG